MWPADHKVNKLHWLILTDKSGKIFYNNYLHKETIVNLAYYNRALKPNIKMFGFLNAQEFNTRGEFNGLVKSELN